MSTTKTSSGRELATNQRVLVLLKLEPHGFSPICACGSCEDRVRMLDLNERPSDDGMPWSWP